MNDLILLYILGALINLLVYLHMVFYLIASAFI